MPIKKKTKNGNFNSQNKESRVFFQISDNKSKVFMINIQIY